MPVYQSYQVVGAKESVSDIITNISPTDTSFISSAGSETIKNKVFSWQEDSLSATSVSALVEGADVTFPTLSPTVARQNNTQIIAQPFQVSGTVDAMNFHGRAKEFAYQAAKAAKVAKRNLEYSCIGSKQSAVLGTSSTASQFAGFQAQLDSSMVFTTSTIGGNATAFNESGFVAALQNVWTQGAEPEIALVTPTDAGVIANFAQAAGKYQREIVNGKDDRKIINTVNCYVSPVSAETKVVVSRFLAASDTLIYNPEYVKVCSLRNWERETLAKTGDSLKAMIIGEFSLKHMNYFAGAVIRKG